MTKLFLAYDLQGLFQALDRNEPAGKVTTSPLAPEPLAALVEEERSRAEVQREALRAILMDAQSVPLPDHAEAVEIGTEVTVVHMPGGEQAIYTIAGYMVFASPDVERDPNAYRLSYTAPVGAALLGHRVGDTVRVELPSGRQQALRILSIKVASF